MLCFPSCARPGRLTQGQDHYGGMDVIGTTTTNEIMTNGIAKKPWRRRNALLSSWSVLPLRKPATNDECIADEKTNQYLMLGTLNNVTVIARSRLLTIHGLSLPRLCTSFVRTRIKHKVEISPYFRTKKLERTMLHTNDSAPGSKQPRQDSIRSLIT